MGSTLGVRPTHTTSWWLLDSFEQREWCQSQNKYKAKRYKNVEDGQREWHDGKHTVLLYINQNFMVQTGQNEGKIV